MGVYKLYGPPGTGKTTTITKILREVLKQGLCSAGDIYALSFTRSAKWALLEKAEFLKEENVRTLHSFCWRALGLSKDNILKRKELKGFFDREGYTFAEPESEPDEEVAFYVNPDFSGLPGNVAHQLFDYSRHMFVDHNYSWMEGVEELFDEVRYLDMFYEGELLKLAKRFDEFMRSTQKYDFTHALILGYENRHRLELSGGVLVLDEFQDITPLMYEIISAVKDNFNMIVVAGDDDQSIFGFAGSDPRFLIELKADHTEILPQSYRVPKRIHALASALIEKNRNRVRKEYKPTEKNGEIKRISVEAFHNGWDGFNTDEDTLILVRHRFLVEEYKQILESVPHKLLGTVAKIPEACWHAKMILRLKHDMYVPEEQLHQFIENEKVRKALGFKHKAGKTAWEKDKQNFLRALTRRDVTHPGVKRLFSMTEKELLTLFGLTDDSATKWSKRLDDLQKWKKPSLQIGTIHQAKGLEADNVVLDLRCTKKVFWSLSEETENTEEERRVWYVGITRSKEKLTLVEGGGYNAWI